jgi:ABC-2 type transport system permease protein
MAFRTIDAAPSAASVPAKPTRTVHPVLCVARKEVLEMSRDTRLRWAFVIVFLLLTTALALGGEHYLRVRAEQRAAQQAVREQWLSQGRKNPHYAAHDGTFVFKQASGLSFTDPGVTPYTGVASFLEAHRQNGFQFRPARDGGALQRLGGLTAAAVLQLLVPLVIVLLCFGAVAGERETGMYRLLLSAGVRPVHLGLGKLLGAVTVLIGLLVPATLLGFGLLLVTSNRSGIADSAMRTALMVGAYFLYYGTWIGLSLAVSARARSSQVALVGLLAFWVLAVLIVPRVSADIARWRYPTPVALAQAEQIHAESKERGGHDGGRTARREREARLLKQYNVQRIEDLPINPMGLGMQEGEEFTNRIIDRENQRLHLLFQRQNRLQQQAAVLSPVLPLRALSMSLAGSDWEQDFHFAREAESYRRLLVRTMNEELTYKSRPGEDYEADAAAWAQVPRFRYSPPGLSWVVRHQAGAGLTLALWCGLAMLSAFLCMRKASPLC